MYEQTIFEHISLSRINTNGKEFVKKNLFNKKTQDSLLELFAISK